MREAGLPIRLRLSRAKGFNLQEHSHAVNDLPAVNCARPSKWGNPFRIGDPVYYFADARPQAKRKNVIEIHPKKRLGRAIKRHGGMTAAEAVERFRHGAHAWFQAHELLEIRGKNLACWCALPKPGETDICHAAVLLELANHPVCEEVG